MKTYTLFLPLALALSVNGEAQTTKPKTPQQKPERAVKGTVQMAGDNGKLNVTYTLGEVDPINVTLTDVRFTIAREAEGMGVVAPTKEEKLLIVDFVAHNPNPEAIYLKGGLLKFTGVDQESVNRVARGGFTRAKTGEPFTADLKPAQKIELRAVIVVSAAGTVPKLMVEHQSGGPVLRYDLRAHLKPLSAPFADPKDETGMTAADVLQCAPGTYYPMPWVDIKLAENPVAFHGQKFGNNVTAPIKQFCSIKFDLKGRSPKPAFLRFHAEVYDENGEKFDMAFAAQPSGEGYLNRSLELDAEYAIRLVAILPVKTKPKFVKVWETASGSKGRTYVFNLP